MLLVDQPPRRPDPQRSPDSSTGRWGAIGMLTAPRLAMLAELADGEHCARGRSRRKTQNNLVRLGLAEMRDGQCFITVAGADLLKLCTQRGRRRKRPVGRPRDLPDPVVLASRKSHGTRVRYVAGCRCDECTLANRTYARARLQAQRSGDWNGLVDAGAARRHIERLSAAGVGRRTIADISGVADSSIQEIKTGRKKRIRAQTEREILRATPKALNDASLVPAGRTWKLIEKLLREGFTKGQIARRIGCKRAALQLRRDRVTARTALKIEKLYRLVMTI